VTSLTAAPWFARAYHEIFVALSGATAGTQVLTNGVQDCPLEECAKAGDGKPSLLAQQKASRQVSPRYLGLVLQAGPLLDASLSDQPC